MMNNIIVNTQKIISILVLGMLFVLPVSPSIAHAEEASQTGEGAMILQAFNEQHQHAEREKTVSLKTKQQIMFLMGVVLLILVLITAGLGLALGLYGKQVFAAHMIFAGLSITLGIAHAIVGLVWFFPF